MIGVYIVETPFAVHAEGERLELTDEEAQNLSSYVREATPDDVGSQVDDVPAEEAPEGEAALVNNAITEIKRSNDKAIEKITAALSKTQGNKAVAMPRVPAQQKQPVFKCMAEMLKAQVKARMGETRSRNMLWQYQLEQKTTPLGSNEGTSSQGGYAVKPEWYREIWDKVRNYPKLLEKTERISVSGNTLNIPALSETSLVDGSRHGGIRSYWVSEGDTLTSSYPALTQVQCVLNTQAILVYVTNQLLEDSNIESFDAFINKKVALEVLWSENYSVTSGSGSGQPKGILNQASLVTVTKDSNDTTGGMVSFKDLANMMGRLYPPSRANAVWLVNSELYSALNTMTFPTAASTSVYPAAGLSYDYKDADFPMKIFGRPVIEVMNLPQAGALGDIILCDLTQLVTAEKPGLEVAVSDQIQFTTLQTAFRFVRRYDIQSPWTAALTPFDGSSSRTYSPFICLQARGT